MTKNSPPTDIPKMMTMSGELIFTKNGDWLHDGKPVTHDNIATYFSKHLRFAPDLNSWVVEVEGKCVPATIEDTAQVVRTFLTDDQPWKILLSDQSEEEFQPQTLQVSDENVFYCQRPNTNKLVRILRSPMQSLFPHLAEDPNGFQLVLHGKRYPITQRIEE